MVDIQFLKGALARSPDLYLDELQTQLYERRGVEVSLTSIHRTLTRCGFTLKKITKNACERSAEKRAAFRYEYGIQFTPEQTVFVDESSFDRRTGVRNRGWTPRGERLSSNVFFVRGRRYSLLPALSLQGIIHVKIVEGSFTSRLFYEFIEGLLDKMQPFPAPNSVIVMDNARIHKDPRVIDLIVSRGMRVMFLPPYSPDYNPIELAFSAIKAYVRRHKVIGGGSK
ncbi:hypothetical protein ONZ45_g15735 [Pleurotus djamor]|nr:hypothetical protein ONZ45_g15735 [Pleurotus djamor]